jgi:hypothetical protein
MKDAGKTIFSTVEVPEDDPILLRPLSTLTVDAIIQAARLVTAFPRNKRIARFAPVIVTFRLTPAELAELRALADDAVIRN